MKSKNLFLILTGFFVTFLSCKSQPAALKSSNDTLSYCLGVTFGNNIKPTFKEVNATLVAAGLKDVYESKEMKITLEFANQFINDFYMKLQQQAGGENMKKAMEFLEKNKSEAGVKTTASGLQYKVIKEGTGEKPAATDKVTVHYEGKLLDGTIFDSSIKRGQPASFPLNQVIPGWTEGLQLMSPGAKYMFFIPPQLGYGERGAGGSIGPNTLLIFEVELISVEKTPVQ